MRRNVRQRAAASILALLAQAGLISVVMQSRTTRVHTNDDVPGGLIYLQRVEVPEVRRRRQTYNAPLALNGPVAESQPVPNIEPAEASPVTTGNDLPVPIIDWYRAIESRSQAVAEKMEERELNGDLLDSRPKVMAMPERPHRAGDQERYADGAVVTWQNERCYVVLEPAALGPRPLSVCKESTLAERRAESHRKELEKAMKPEYLRRPLPRPRQANPAR